MKQTVIYITECGCMISPVQVNTGITLQMTSWHSTDIHTNTVRTNFNHFSTLPQNLVLLWSILFEKYFFKHSNPVSSIVSEIKSGVRGSYAAEKVGTLKVNDFWTSAFGRKKLSNCPYWSGIVIFAQFSKVDFQIVHFKPKHLFTVYAVSTLLKFSSRKKYSQIVILNWTTYLAQFRQVHF